MRNYNSKTHTKPIVQHAFKKSDRKYPEARKLTTLVSNQQRMVIQKPVLKMSKPNQLLATEQSIHQTYRIPSHTDSLQQTYFLILQQPFPVFDRKSSLQQTDLFCLWFKNLQNLSEGKRSLLIKQIQYTLTDWSQDQFPSLLYLTIDGIYGYLDANSVPSNRVAVLRLDQTMAIERNGVYVYDLIYKTYSANEWQIPKDLTHFKIGISDQNSNPIQLPLPQPLSIEITIKNKI